MKQVFMTAEEARSGSVNNQLIYNEIRDIEQQIISAVRQGLYTLSINNTYMTASTIPVQPADPTISTPTNSNVILLVKPEGDGIASGINYFRVWKCLDCGIETTYDQEALRDQMNRVMNHFKDLGYVIDRRITSDNDTTFYWKIMW